MTLLTPEVEALRGRSVSFTAPDEIGRAAIRYFATAVGDDNPLWTSADAARAAGHDDVVAPPTMLCETNQYMTVRRDDHGFAGFMWDVPVPDGARLVRGGNSYRFHRYVRPDDVVTATFTVVDITEKATRTGRLLVLVNEIAYTAADGELLATNCETLIWQVAS